MERPKNLTNEQWRVALSIYNSAKKQGDKFPELTVAQAALETGWFKHKSGKNNYFGQKATQSQKGTSLNTTEVANNKYYKTKQKFRDYDSIDEAMSDRVKKWSSKYNDAKTPDEALSKIWRYDKNKGTGVGYATDIKYGEKVKSILGSLGTALSDAEPTQETEEEQTPHINPIDFNTPEYSGITFSEEEPEQTAQQASQDLLEESFLEEADALLAQSQTQQEQPIQEYAPAPQYNVELAPIEYQPITQFQDGGRIEVKDSSIEGKGIFTKDFFRQGDLIGLTHTNSQPSTELGKFHNHSENPNTESLLIGNKRFLFAKKDIDKNKEVTVDYKKQPELEQPNNFK
jgi:hypothetical protein